MAKIAQPLVHQLIPTHPLLCKSASMPSGTRRNPLTEGGLVGIKARLGISHGDFVGRRIHGAESFPQKKQENGPSRSRSEACSHKKAIENGDPPKGEGQSQGGCRARSGETNFAPRG